MWGRGPVLESRLVGSGKEEEGPLRTEDEGRLASRLEEEEWREEEEEEGRGDTWPLVEDSRVTCLKLALSTVTLPST